MATTAVSGTITAADTQVYANGTYTFQLVGPAGYDGDYYVGATKMTTVLKTITGALDAGGAFTSIDVTKTASIQPAGTTWLFTVSPQANAPSYQQNIGIVSGTTLDISSTITPPAIKVLPTNSVMPVAYTDGEIVGPVVGTTYYNSTSSVVRVCTAVSGGVGTWGTVGP